MTGRAMAVFTMAMFLGVALMQWLTGLAASAAAGLGLETYTAVFGATAQPWQQYVMLLDATGRARAGLAARAAARTAELTIAFTTRMIAPSPDRSLRLVSPSHALRKSG